VFNSVFFMASLTVKLRITTYKPLDAIFDRHGRFVMESLDQVIHVGIFAGCFTQGFFYGTDAADQFQELIVANTANVMG